MIDRNALIAARDEAGLSQSQLAALVKCSQQLIGQLENGVVTSTKYLPKIATVLNVPAGVLDPDYANIGVVDPAARSPLERDFPVYSSAEGGPGEILRSVDPFDWVPRPAPVAHARQAYGMLVSGTSMAPEYRPGDTAIVNPVLPIVSEEVYVFYRELHGEARATIKHLRRASATEWHVTQHNPPPGQKAEFTLSRREWAICHRVLGKYSRL